MTSKIPPRLTYSGIDAPLYVPMDGEGNAKVPHKLTAELIQTPLVEALAANVALLEVADYATVNGDLEVDGDAKLYGNCIVEGATGMFIGNGQGLTKLPPTTLALTPSFYFQSDPASFIPPNLTNRFFPEAPLPGVQCTITCDLYGKPPGLYFWKTDANISIQNLFNSASGLVYWDGTKVSGETTYSLYQPGYALNPDYSLTFSWLFYTSLTGFYVTMESTNTSINPLQYDHYYVNFFKMADLGNGQTSLPVPTGVGVTGTTSTTTTVNWDYVLDNNYAVYISGPGGPTGPNYEIKGYSAGSTGSFGVTGLTGGSGYTAQVQASQFVGSQTLVSPTSAPVAFTTI